MLILCHVNDVIFPVLQKVVARYNANNGEHLQLEQITSPDLQRFVIPEAQTDVLYYFDDPELYDGLAPISADVHPVIEALEASGDQVLFVEGPVRASTREALQAFGFLEPRGGQREFAQCHSVAILQGDLLITDMPDDAVAWLESGRVAIIFDMPYNRVPELDEHQFAVRVRGWPEIPNAVRILAERMAATDAKYRAVLESLKAKRAPATSEECERLGRVWGAVLDVPDIAPAVVAQMLQAHELLGAPRAPAELELLP